MAGAVAAIASDAAKAAGTRRLSSAILSPSMTTNAQPQSCARCAVLANPSNMTAASPLPAPRILACGDGALSVEFGEAVDPSLNARVLALDAALATAPPPGFREAVPTYRSLFVEYDPVAIDFADMATRLLALAASPAPPAGTARRWSLPVVYGGAFGIDLEAVAERAGISPSAVIDRHAGALYRVYMIGFTPGFAYLGGLDPALATPRLGRPRRDTPSGSVSIGGVQAAVQCLPGPSGWSLLGRTPVRSYHPARDPVFLLAPGDEVIFAPMEADLWEALDRAAASGEPVAERLA